MKFTESTYYIIKDGKVYRNVYAGLFEEKWAITRKVSDDVKIHVEHFDCACPFSRYYILDYKNGRVYKSDEQYSYLGSNINELVETLKAHGINWVVSGKSVERLVRVVKAFLSGDEVVTKESLEAAITAEYQLLVEHGMRQLDDDEMFRAVAELAQFYDIKYLGETK